MPHQGDWSPNPGPQTAFLQSSVFEVLYGGAAGGGKTDALLIDAVSFVGLGYGSGYTALVLRRTFPEIEKSLLRRSNELYPRFGGVFKVKTNCWAFPGGELIYFGHAEEERSVLQYQSAAFQRVLFDELTSFTEFQYTYLFSRIRSSRGVPCGIRAATNPGGVGHEWVRQRWLPWVSKYAQRPAKPGKARYYVRDEEVVRGTPKSVSRTFIPALLEDNPYLDIGDPQYRASLQQLDVLRNEQLEKGNWDAEPACRDFWDRAKIQHLDCAGNPEAQRVRSWDFGSTKKGDWSVGALGYKTDIHPLVVEHIERFRGKPDLVMRRFAETLERDRRQYGNVVTTIPQDPGSAGDFVVADFQREFPQYPIFAVRPTGDKLTRFRPLAARALFGSVAVVDDGSWSVRDLHNECEAFPRGPYDDQVDALSDLYASVSKPARVCTESYE